MIRYSIEALWRFKCEACSKWWSIGDHQISGARVHGETLTCPHCGTKAELAPAEPLETTEPIQAKVEEDGWIEWKGGECPVAKGVLVYVKVLNGEKSHGPIPAEGLDWSHGDREGYDIIAYRVIEPATVSDDGWIEWNGGKRPVPADTQVEVQLAEIEEIDSGVACAFAWEHRDSHFNIVAYRVLKKGSAA